MRLSINNFKSQPPLWFRRVKKAVLTLTVAANGMIASYGFHDQLTTTRWQLWCTLGIGALMEAIESLLKDDITEEQPTKPE